MVELVTLVRFVWDLEGWPVLEVGKFWRKASSVGRPVLEVGRPELRIAQEEVGS